MNINLHISSNVRVGCSDEKVLAHLRKTLSIDNPMYNRLKRMGKSTWQTPRVYEYYSDVAGGVEVPRGMWKRLIEFCHKMNVWPEITTDLVEIKRKEPMFSFIKLRDYQEPIVEKIVANKPSEGLIVLSTGGGKTIIACELIEKFGLKATVLVPNTVLLKQFKAELEKNYGIQPGIIGDGKKEIKDTTIATYQSLIADQSMGRSLAAQTSILICDESQSAVSDKRLEVLGMFKPKHIYGLTATPRRSKEDGRTKAIGFYFGDIIAEHKIERMKPQVEVKCSGSKIPVGEYHKLIDAMVEDNSRNTLITGMALGQILEGRKTLVLTKRIEHYKLLKKKMPDSDRIHYIDSEDPERNEKLIALKAGLLDYNVIFGTTSLLAVGTDIPSLDTLIIACDMKSDVLIEQSVGRIQRLLDGKESTRVIDICDNKNPILLNQFRSRLKLYRDNDWQVEGLPSWL